MNVLPVSPVTQEMERQLRSFSRMFDVQKIEETNKRVIFKGDESEVKNFASNLRREGYEVEVKKGLKSMFCYIAIYI